MLTPLGTDLYSRIMAGVFDERSVIGVSTVWQSFFGRPETNSQTVYSPNANLVEIDIIRGNNEIAALIQRGTNSKNLDKKDTQEQNFSNFGRVYPLIKEEAHITADQLLSRLAGENPYQQMSRTERNTELARNHHQEHIRRIVRKMEVMAYESIFTGKMTAIDDTTNTDLIYDFRRNSGNFISVTVPWDDAAAAILSDIDGACDVAEENGNVTPDFMFLSGDVANVFFSDTIIQKFADVKGFSFISVGANNPVPSNLQFLVNAGAIARGYIFTPKGRLLWIFCYNKTYSKTGVNYKYMPDGKALIGYSGARCDRYFGPSDTFPVTPSENAWYIEKFGFDMMNGGIMPPNIKNLSAVVNPGMFYFDAYQDNGRTKATIRTQTAPIFATTQTDAFVILSDLIGVAS